ncbi:MAG: hypothetical protein ACKO5A_10780 [Actinomycetota bacterium]
MRRPTRLPTDTTATLFGLLTAIEPFTLVALAAPGARRGRRDHEVAVHALRPDPRSGAASLFGIRAPQGAPAIGVSLIGTGRRTAQASWERPPPSALIEGTTLHIDLVLDRRRGHQSRIRTQDLDGTQKVLEDAPGAGLVVDAMYCVLGIPVPGSTPSHRNVTLGLWSHRLLEALTAGGTLSWALAAAMHPASPADLRTPLSPEALVESGRRLEASWSWTGFHRLVIAGEVSAPDLLPDEAAWMDTTMFARWCDQSLPPAAAVESGLLRSGSEAAAGFCQVLRLLS